jgi:tRNA pseudouridine38-40 synthase
MSLIRLEIEYDGSGFAGWAAQPGLRTVRGELEDALARLLRQPVSLTVAGRTDAGVHAWGQVASFETPAEVPPDLARRLNGITGRDLTVLSATPAADSFDARRDARSRTYCYRVLARAFSSPFEEGRALWWPAPLDEDALHECAAALPGRHDFTAFTPTDSDHVRFEREVLAAEWRRRGEVLEFWIEADTFMRHMVRILVGTMLEVGAGRRELAGFARLLEGAPRRQAGETAPAHGLYLAAVRYQEPPTAPDLA